MLQIAHHRFNIYLVLACLFVRVPQSGDIQLSSQAATFLCLNTQNGSICLSALLKDTTSELADMISSSTRTHLMLNVKQKSFEYQLFKGVLNPNF